LVADADIETDPAHTPAEERNLRAVTDVLHFWNTHDVDGILNFYNDDIVWTNVALEEVYTGKQEVRAFINRLLTAFPDLSFEVVDKFARDDNVSERWYIRGTHLGPFIGIPPTGKRLEIPGISMVRMRDARFLSDWFIMDAAAGMRQMGLLPPLSATDLPVVRAALWDAVNRAVVARAAAAIAVAGLASAGRVGDTPAGRCRGMETRHVSDAPSPQPDPDAAIGRLVRHVLTSFDTASALAPRQDQSALLTLIVNAAARMVSAGAASLFLIDEATAELTFEVAIGPKAAEVARFRVPIGHGIAGAVAATGQAISISAPEQDPRFASEIARSVGHLPQSILCVPMRHGDKVIGVLEALDKTGRETFTTSDIEVLSWFAEIAALAVEQARRLDDLRAALAEALAGAGERDEQSLDLVDTVLRHTRQSPEHLAAMEIAAIISEIAGRGDAEQRLCRQWLGVFRDYIRARDSSYPLDGLSGLPWSR
jgi:steroid delta-isomerase-like uncharacterized protein